MDSAREFPVSVSDFDGPPVPLRAKIGRAVRDRRKALGLTLARVAARVGCTLSHLSHLETGRCSPGLGTLDRLAAALGLHTSELLELAGE